MVGYEDKQITNLFYEGEIFNVRIMVSGVAMDVIFDSEKDYDKMLELYTEDSVYFYEGIGNGTEAYILGKLNNPHCKHHCPILFEKKNKLKDIDRIKKAYLKVISFNTETINGGRKKNGIAVNNFDKMRSHAKKLRRNYNLDILGI